MFGWLRKKNDSIKLEVEKDIKINKNGELIVVDWNNFFSTVNELTVFPDEVTIEAWFETELPKRDENADPEDLLPISRYGVSIYQKGELFKKLILKEYVSYGLISALTNEEDKNEIQFALNIVNYLSEKIYQDYDFKSRVNKKIRCPKMIYGYHIPKDFTVDIQEPNEQYMEVMKRSYKNIFGIEI